MVWDEPDRRDPDSKLYAPKRPRPKKDRRRWCRGKVGKPHQPVIAYHPPLHYARGEVDWRCGWRCWRYLGGGPAEPHTDHTLGGGMIHNYRCHHVERCAECGKILTRTVECPEVPR